MKLTIDQINILKQAELNGNKLYLQWQLDRKQYTSINEVLETIWLKRNRKEKAHIADCSKEELEEAIGDIIETGEVETLKETIKKFQFYETPKEVAEYLVELADIWEFDNILEPSAGHWAIAEQIIKKKHAYLHLIELDKNKKEILEEKFWNCVWCYDFLLYEAQTFDKIIANPPFSKSQDVKHILHMYKLLSYGGRIVSIASSTIKTREWKLYDELRSLNPEFIELPEWSFKDSWTMVNTVIVVIHK